MTQLSDLAPNFKLIFMVLIFQEKLLFDTSYIYLYILFLVLYAYYVVLFHVRNKDNNNNYNYLLSLI